MCIGSQLLESKYGLNGDRVRISSNDVPLREFFEKNQFEVYRLTPQFTFLERKKDLGKLLGGLYESSNDSPVNNNIDYVISDKFTDNKDIVNSLNSKELFYLTSHNYGKSEPLFNKSFKIKGKPAGFIQLYKYSKNSASVVFAIAPKYRSNGLIDVMIQTMLKEANNIEGIDQIIWMCNSDDEISKYLATKYKFEKVSIRSSKNCLYKISLNKRSSKIDSFLSE
jgi:RimJ/RimL family protein N-acetyltransferase